MILTIIQARSSSSRLPNKVIRQLLGKPMLFRQIERIQRAQLVERIVVATSLDSSDDLLFRLCKDHAIDCWRGNLNDVLDRFYHAAKIFKADHIVRLTGDCPLVDPELIDKVISEHLRFGCDYTSNILDISYPDGLDVEVFKFSALEKAWIQASSGSEREHVTPFIYDNPDKFTLHSVKSTEDLSCLRLTVDNLEDFNLVEKIYMALYFHNPAFSTSDILSLIKAMPELRKINSHITRNEGYKKSLVEENLIKKSEGS